MNAVDAQREDLTSAIRAVLERPDVLRALAVEAAASALDAGMEVSDLTRGRVVLEVDVRPCWVEDYAETRHVVVRPEAAERADAG
jgi:hypothetical protein